MTRRLIAAAAIAGTALLATHGVAAAHEAAAFCIDGTDTYEVVALTSEPGFTWTGDDVSWTATWADGVTDEGPAPEGCTTPATTTTTTSPVTTSPAEPTTSTVPPQASSTAPVTTAPPDTSTPPAGPGVPPTSAVLGRTELPGTGSTATAALWGAIAVGAGTVLLIVVAVTRRHEA